MSDFVLVEHPEAGNPPGLVPRDWFENPNGGGRAKGWVALDNAEALNKKNVDELRAVADLVGVAWSPSMKKSELVKLLAVSSEPTAPTGQEG